MTIKVVIKLLLFCLCFQSSFLFGIDEIKLRDYKSRITEHYRKLSEENFNLSQTVSKHCSSNNYNIIYVKKAYYKFLDSWTKLQHIRFGPINDFNNYARIQFWPDKRGVVNRQYLRVINNKDEDYLDYGNLSLKSVALQGIPVLEKIIFDESKDINNFKCYYMIAIVKNLLTITRYSYDIWNSEYKFIEYVEKKELLAQFYNSVLLQLEFIIKNKLAVINSKDKINLKKLEFWRSAYSLKSLKNNFTEIKIFYNKGIREELIKKNFRYLEELDRKFLNTIELFNSIDEPLKFAVKRAETLVILKEIKKNISFLHSIFLVNVSQALSLQIGFNQMDGD